MTFHVIAYGLLQFVFEVDINFIHIYAILFVIEVAIMLIIGRISPRADAWYYTAREVVDMTPWRFAIPTAILLASCIVMTYLLFSPIGLAGDMGISSDGEQKDSYMPGMELHGKYTVFAEGCRGHRSRPDLPAPRPSCLVGAREG